MMLFRRKMMAGRWVLADIVIVEEGVMWGLVFDISGSRLPT
jgi:hypothetical protein